MSCEEEDEESFRFYIFNKKWIYSVSDRDLGENFAFHFTDGFTDKFSVNKCNIFYR